jgi:hypothetical protein
VRQDDFWHGTRTISPHFEPHALAGYPNDLSAKTRPYDGPVNELGVPLFDFGQGAGRQMHPVTLCQVALGWYERRLAEQDVAHRAHFLRLADWLVENRLPWHGGGAWPVPVDQPRYRLRAPWVSALVQGQALSVLARADRLCPGAAAYRAALDAALVLFDLDVGRGGVRTEDEYGVGFEEYTTDTPSLVFNGLISALWGLSDAAKLAPAGPADRNFAAGVEALLRRLPRYDLGFWSRYCFDGCRVPNVASPYYHRVHIAQLQAMARLAPDPRWGETAERWAAYEARALNRLTALATKALFRGLTYRREAVARAPSG